MNYLFSRVPICRLRYKGLLQWLTLIIVLNIVLIFSHFHRILAHRNNSIVLNQNSTCYIRGFFENSIDNSTCSIRGFVEDSTLPLYDWNCTAHGCESQRRSSPPLLWTFPGSGNTWVRNLIEQATGQSTASVYNDSTLNDLFSHEGRCDTSSICIKAHPTTHTFDVIEGSCDKPSKRLLDFRNSVSKTENDMYQRWQAYRNTCRINGEVMPFTRAIVIDRDPVQAAFSELQRRTLKRKDHGQKSHVNHIPSNYRSRVNKRVWRRFCRDFLRLGVDYLHSWMSYTRFFKMYGPDNLLLIKYEDLIDENRRVDALKTIVQFLQTPLIGDLNCLFRISDDRRINRHQKESQRKTGLHLITFLQEEFEGKTLAAWMDLILAPIKSSDGYFMRITNPVPAAVRSELELVTGLPLPSDRDTREMITVIGQMNSVRSSTASLRTFNIPTDDEIIQCLNIAWKAQQNNQIVVLFAGSSLIGGSSQFIETLLNTLIWLNQNGVGNIVIVSTDLQTYEILTSLNVRTCLHPPHSKYDDPLHSIYVLRLRVIEMLLRSGLSVIHTDADTVWRTDIRKYLLKQHEEMDIISSRGTYPYKEQRLWKGSTLCMGFISIRSATKTAEIFRNARSVASLNAGDDQIGVNRALRKMGVVWMNSDQGIVDGVTVQLLKENVVRRNCSQGEGQIMHCYWRGGNRTRRLDNGIKKLKEKDLWVLRSNWKECMRQPANRLNCMALSKD